MSVLSIQHLSDELKPLLLPLSFHDQFLQRGIFNQIARNVDDTLVQHGLVDRFIDHLLDAGLIRLHHADIFEFHPQLTVLLRSTFGHSGNKEHDNQWIHRFVDVFGTLADQYTSRQLHEQEGIFSIHHQNFHRARNYAERLKMVTHFIALTQSLATFAQNKQDHTTAGDLFKQQVDFCQRHDQPAAQASASHQLGLIAQHRSQYDQAEQWYCKSLAISEKLGLEHFAASTYHQLGLINQDRCQFEKAQQWFLKALAISKKHSNEHGQAITCYQLGLITQEQHQYDQARQWYDKSLAIEIKHGNETAQACTAHQLGLVAEQCRQYDQARQWYDKSLAISEKLGIDHYAASTTHQLGLIAQEQHEFNKSEQWYRKSLAISEKQNNEQSQAMTCGQLGILAQLQNNYVESGKWLVKSICLFNRINDQHYAQISVSEFKRTFHAASEQDRSQLESLWRSAGLQSLATKNKSADDFIPI